MWERFFTYRTDLLISPSRKYDTGVQIVCPASHVPKVDCSQRDLLWLSARLPPAKGGPELVRMEVVRNGISQKKHPLAELVRMELVRIGIGQNGTSQNRK